MAGVGLEPRSPEPASFLQGQAAEEVLTATLRESTGLATAPEETSVSVGHSDNWPQRLLQTHLLYPGMAAALTAGACPRTVL